MGELPAVWIISMFVGVAAAALLVGLVTSAIVIRGRRDGADPGDGALLAEAERDTAVLEGLELLSNAPNRKLWADKVSSTLTTLTGATGAAVILRAAGGDTMSLAGSSVPLVIRNLETTLREPHGPSRRALESGEPVAMSAGELPAWAAAAGFETGAVFPILFHGASIGLAYTFGKPWQAPSADALATSFRFITLAAFHYSVAAPFAAPAMSVAATPRRSATAPESSIRVPAAIASRTSSTSSAELSAALVGAAPAPTPLSSPRVLVERRRIDLSGVVVDPRTERCVIDGRAVALSKTEFDLLYTLASSGGEVVTSEQLVRSVWGDFSTAPSSALDVTIHRVRRKLGKAPGGAELVRTVRGRGYAISVPEQAIETRAASAKVAS